jgi:UDP-N-acetylmuramate--alanine ligase
MLAKMFAHAFDAADILLVMDVFPAGEMAIPGISGKTVVSSVTDSGEVGEVDYIPNRKKLIAHLMDIVRPGDLVITQGAGDVTQIGPAFIATMKQRDEKGQE